VPSGLVLIAWAGLAVAGLVAFGVLAVHTVDNPAAGEGVARSVALPLLALAPFVVPFAVALLFGNLDAAFPILYGLMLLGVLAGDASDRSGLVARSAAGASLAVASIVKVHPSPMALWFLVRGLRERRAGRRPTAWLILGAAVAVGLAILALSLLVGGIGPWLDWLTVVRVGAGSEVVDVRNIGPASQLALVAGSSESLARIAQILVTASVIGLTVWAAWTRDDPVEGFAWATVASLVVLPLTWYHYPVALLPVAIVAWLRSERGFARRRTTALLGAAIVITVLALLAPVTMWVAVGLVLMAVRTSLPGRVFEETRVLFPSRISIAPLPGRTTGRAAVRPTVRRHNRTVNP
jgi:hypothetical protein